MDKKQATTAVIISATGSFAIVTIHDIMKGKPNAKAYIGGAFLFLVLAAGADVAPGVAGPFAYLVLSAAVLTDGTSVLKKVGNVNTPVGDKVNVSNKVSVGGTVSKPVGGSPNGIVGGTSNPSSPLDSGTSGGILPKPTLGGNSGTALARLIVKEAETFQGTPYLFGGASPGGFDCSGLVYYLGKKYAGITLPRVSYDQAKTGTPVNLSQIAPGDLVFFYNNEHEGIYIGGGMFIHAPHTGDVVKISPLAGYYASNLSTIRRVF